MMSFISYDEFIKQIENCKKCELYLSRTKPVVGEGNLNSKFVLIGEAPGKNEDIYGRPFVGRAGKVLNRALDEIKVDRINVYITNVVKCRPPKNRKPKTNEVLSCLHYLIFQLMYINPLKIVLLGGTAVKYLYDDSFPYKKIPKEKKISEIRGKLGNFKAYDRTFQTYATYHPAMILRNPRLYEVFKEDLDMYLKS
jgi:DNA polymerase